MISIFLEIVGKVELSVMIFGFESYRLYDQFFSIIETKNNLSHAFLFNNFNHFENKHKEAGPLASNSLVYSRYEYFSYDSEIQI